MNSACRTGILPDLGFCPHRGKTVGKDCRRYKNWGQCLRLRLRCIILRAALACGILRDFE